MKLLVLTNILTPYRMALFEEIERQLAFEQGSIIIAAMSETEPNRPWFYSDLQTEATVLLSSYTVSFAGAHTHFTRGLSELISKIEPDFTICAGSYLSPAVWQALWIQRIQRGGFRTLFWSESHLRELKERNLPSRTLREAARKAIYPRFDAFLSPGALADQLIRKYSSGIQEIIRFPNTIDDAFYDAEHLRLRPQRNRLREKYDIERDKFVFVTPARLTKVKGIDAMLELARGMHNRQDVIFTIAGTGEQEDQLRATARSYGVDLRILGHRPQSDMVELYALADCFLLPSISDPNPLSVLEALWSGLPLLLSSHVGNYPEAVQKDRNGFVFDYADPVRATALFDRIASSDAAWRASAATFSRQIAQNEFDTKRVVRSLLSGLAELTPRPRTRTP